jgi:hypothetical protein
MLRWTLLCCLASGLALAAALRPSLAGAGGYTSPVADESTAYALSTVRRFQGLDPGSFQNTYYFSSFSGDDSNDCSPALPCQSYGYARGICTDYTRCVFAAGEWWSRYVLRLDSAAPFSEGEAVAWGVGDADRGGKVLHWRLDGVGLGILVLRMDRPLGHRDSTGIAPLPGETVVGATSGSSATIVRIDDTLIGTAPVGHVQGFAEPGCDPGVAPICRLFESSDPELPAYIDGGYENPEDHAPFAQGGDYAHPIFGVRGEPGSDGGALACAGLRFSRFWNDVFSSGIASQDEGRLLLVDCHAEKVFNDDSDAAVCGKGDSDDIVKCPGGAGTCGCAENRNGATTHGNAWIVGANVSLHNYMDSSDAAGATIAATGSGGMLFAGLRVVADGGAVADSRPASAAAPWTIRNVGGDVVVIGGTARAGGANNTGGNGGIVDLSAGIDAAHIDPRGDAGASISLTRFTAEPWLPGAANIVPVQISGPGTAPDRYLHFDALGVTFAQGATLGPGNGFSVGSPSATIAGPKNDARIRVEGVVMDEIRRYFRFERFLGGELDRWHVTLEGAYDDDDALAGGSFCEIDGQTGWTLSACQGFAPPHWSLLTNSIDIGSEAQPNAVDGKISQDQSGAHELPGNAIHPDRTEIYDRFVGPRRVSLPGQEFGYFPKEILGTQQDITAFDLLIRLGGARRPIAKQWTLAAPTPAPDDRFGAAVGISADTAVVGADGDDDAGAEAGSAWVFVRDGGDWTQQAQLLASDAAADDGFGGAVAIDGDTAVVGSGGADAAGADAGAGYVFVRSGSLWSEQAQLLASDAAAGDGFGSAAAIDGDTLVIGAPSDDVGGLATGSAYVFVRSGSLWSEQAQLTASDGAADDRFGVRVAIHADTVVVGADGDDGAGAESGSAYVFVRSGSVWSEQVKLTASDAAAGDGFGGAVAIDGDTAVVGSSGADAAGADAGAGYVFVRSGSLWSEQAQLTASDGAAGDGFGTSVAIRGDGAVVGADGVDVAGAESGAAYVFERSGGIWSEASKLMASGAAAGDHFAASVALDADTALLGAFGDGDGGAAAGSAGVRDLFASAGFSLAASQAGGVAWAAFVAGPVVSIETPTAATAADVATALAQAIGSEPALTGLGVSAQANGGTLVVAGVFPEEVQVHQDSDDDGLLNDAETDTGIWVATFETGTDPFDADTDDDGLLDGVESNRGTFFDPSDAGTDPNDADTDDDGFPDGDEVAGGYDPVDEYSNPLAGIPALPPTGRLLLALLVMGSARAAMARRPAISRVGATRARAGR